MTSQEEFLLAAIREAERRAVMSRLRQELRMTTSFPPDASEDFKTGWQTLVARIEKTMESP